MSLRPKPYAESQIENIFWQEDPGDKYLPRPGFITDFVLSTRGIETPTLFSMWSSIFIISSALKRQSYLRWWPRPLFPNFFIFFVGPPRILAKTESAFYGLSILKDFHNYCSTEEISEIKRANILAGGATPQALEQYLQPVENYVEIDGRLKMVNRGSQAAVVSSELTAFLGKEKYNIGLVTALTKLYDCEDTADSITITRGNAKLENVYMTLLGATTPDSLKESVPDLAFGEGFMSRVIMIVLDSSVRVYPFPSKVEGGPSTEELAKRLAWLSENAMGEYTLTKEAYNEYAAWYYPARANLIKKSKDKNAKAIFRKDIQLLKLATIMRAQRYEPGRDIDVEDLHEAMRILDATYETAYDALDEVGANQWTKHYIRVRDIIKGGPIIRRKLLQKMSPYGCFVGEVNEILRHLKEEDRIEVELDGEQKQYPSSKGTEIYKWKKARRSKIG